LNVGDRDALHQLDGVLTVDVSLQHVRHVKDRTVSSGKKIYKSFIKNMELFEEKHKMGHSKALAETFFIV
jgi:hypothetical protein